MGRRDRDVLHRVWGVVWPDRIAGSGIRARLPIHGGFAWERQP
jgi:hypothetical protein